MASDHSGSCSDFAGIQGLFGLGLIRLWGHCCMVSALVFLPAVLDSEQTPQNKAITVPPQQHFSRAAYNWLSFYPGCDSELERPGEPSVWETTRQLAGVEWQ